MIMRKFHVLALLLIVFTSCNKDDEDENSRSWIAINSEGLNIPDSPFNYDNQGFPNYLRNGPVNQADNTPNNNPVTNEGATLGRVLFYDKLLSLNKTISCGSCHSAASGFSDSKTLSDGFDGGKTGRHSMSLANSRFYNNGRFFWDERARTLEDQVLLPIQDPVEMGMSLDSVIARLEKTDYYPDLFTNAFGNSEITEGKISLSLAQFIRSMVSFQSKYDQGRSQVANSSLNFPNFTNSENNGKSLFLSNRLSCGSCHGTDAFIAPGSRNNGLDATTTDAGVGGDNGNSNDIGEFKVGSLKNIGVSGPYMHDGRFATLQEVVNHYNDGVQNHPNLSNPLRLGNGQVRRLNLTDNEKNDLIAFLHTLTDDVMINDEKFSDPFSE